MKDADHPPPAATERVDTGFDPQTGRQLKRIGLVFAALLLAALALVSALRWQERRELAGAAAAENAQLPPVVVTTVASGADGRGLSLPGQTAAWYESTIYARVNGYVGQWFSDIGDHVRQGQTLATIETPELDAQLAAARAQLNAAEAEVRVRQAEAELATTTYERWRDSPKGVVSEQEREEKKADFDGAGARLNAARAQVALRQADVDHDLALTQFKNVTAPFDGVVVERRIDIGNLVTAGSTTATAPLYRMSQDRPIRVFVDVPQSAAAELMKPGVTARVRAGESAPVEGKVARTARAIDPQARTMKVEIDLPNRDGRLVPGMYVNVDLRLDNGGALEVPAAAMVFRSKGPQVAVVGADGRVHFRAVAIAHDEGSRLELASGVAAGDKVVLNISSRIADGDAVQVQEASAAGPAGGGGSGHAN